jgi:hypothetical protein
MDRKPEYVDRGLIVEAAEEFMAKMGTQNIKVFQENISHMALRSDILQTLADAAQDELLRNG